MRKQHGLGERRLAAGDDRVDGDADQRLQPLQRVRIEGQRHQRRPGLDNPQVEFFGNVIAETAGAHFGDGLAATGNHQ